jgi:acetyltransferase-like isoleucine patch superfamily enzyme
VPKRPRPSGRKRVWVAGDDAFSLEVVSWASDARYVVRGLVNLHSDRTADGARHYNVRDLSDVPKKHGPVVLGTLNDPLGDGERLVDAGWHFEPLVHPSATIGRKATHDQIGVIGPGVRIGAEASLWRHVCIDANAVIGGHTILEDGVVVGASATIGREARVCAGSSIGAGARIPNGAFVAPRTSVAAHAVFSDNDS